jgi:hypothetical protein
MAMIKEMWVVPEMVGTKSTAANLRVGLTLAVFQT